VVKILKGSGRPEKYRVAGVYVFYRRGIPRGAKTKLKKTEKISQWARLSHRKDKGRKRRGGWLS